MSFAGKNFISRESFRWAPKADWQLADLIDFEYLLERDRDLNASSLAERDRRLFDTIMAEDDGAAKTKPAWNRRWLFRRWLDLRREESSEDQPLPGGVLASAWRLINEVLAVLGVLAGAGLAANLLRYDGVQPVNVAAFLGWLVLAQLALVLLAACVFLLRRAGCFFTELSLITGLMRWLWSWLALGLSRQALHRVSAERRLEMRAFFGRIAGRRSLFGEAALWPLAGALQWFGICFNAGALLATVLLVVFSDRAFGWQSAVDFQSTQIHAFVELLARPWTWVWPEGAPTLEEVMGSKIVLKDGIKQLATENLVSWWPFLCLALVTYGLLPRATLWSAALMLGQSARRRVSFRHVSCDRLYDRMVAPVVQTSAKGEMGQGGEVEIRRRGTEALHGGEAAFVETSPRAVLAIPEDLAGALETDVNVWRERIEARFRWRLREVLEWPAEDSRQGAVLRRIRGKLAETNSHDPPGLILLDEAWQPPIAEKMQSLRAAREVLGEAARLMVLLIGRPGENEVLTAPSAAEVRIWEQQAAVLGDVGLRVEPWME